MTKPTCRRLDARKALRLGAVLLLVGLWPDSRAIAANPAPAQEQSTVDRLFGAFGKAVFYTSVPMLEVYQAADPAADKLGKLLLKTNEEDPWKYRFVPAKDDLRGYTLIEVETGYEEYDLAVYHTVVSDTDPTRSWLKIGFCATEELRETGSCTMPVLYGWVLAKTVGIRENRQYNEEPALQTYEALLIKRDVASPEDPLRKTINAKPFAAWTEKEKQQASESSFMFLRAPQALLDKPEGMVVTQLLIYQNFIVLDRRGEWHKIVALSGACQETYTKDAFTGQIGWIRFTDEKTGTPLVWWHTRGC